MKLITRFRKLAAVVVVLVACATIGLNVEQTNADTDEVVCDSRSVAIKVLGYRQTIAGTYCRPADAEPVAMLALVSGITYDRTYWDFPHEPQRYSYARQAAAAGYGTFAVDRLGVGESSKPISATLTSSKQADAVGQVVTRLRQSGMAGDTFSRVFLVGHSLGSIITILTAAKHVPLDGVAITGISHTPDVPAVAELLAAHMHPAVADPAFDNRLDPGYLTTRPGHRKAFYEPGEADPQVLATDEATKSVFAATELSDPTLLVNLLNRAGDIEVPVLIAIGDSDLLFCPSAGTDCSNSEDLLADERPHYDSAPCVSAVVMPGVGHNLSLHPSAPKLHQKLTDWADKVGTGECPSGPR